jgi:hypothetical protein
MCELWGAECCIDADGRPEPENGALYEKYVDGEGYKLTATREEGYCQTCRVAFKARGQAEQRRALLGDGAGDDAGARRHPLVRGACSVKGRSAGGAACGCARYIADPLEGTSRCLGCQHAKGDHKLQRLPPGRGVGGGGGCPRRRCCHCGYNARPSPC